MGYEIKNIFTVVPNPFHQSYKGKINDGSYYFSVFVTPRLQLDGTLKEFYEMLHWTDYVDIFTMEENDLLKFVSCAGEGSERIGLVRDPILDKLTTKNGQHNSSKEYWEKLFPENTPVEAWPIYLKPQSNLQDAISLSNRIKKVNNEIDKIASEHPNPSIPKNLSQELQFSLGEIYLGPEIFSQDFHQRDDILKLAEEREVLEQERRKAIKAKNESTKFNQEFHKKISALSRYPDILRKLGLIHDFKIPEAETKKLSQKRFGLRFSFQPKINAIVNNIDYPEFNKSVLFVCPFTQCELKVYDNVKRLRACFTRSRNDKKHRNDDYAKIIQDGFIKNSQFTVDQEYVENNSDHFQSKDQVSGNVVGFNGKIFSDDELFVLKQKINNTNNISKGFAIKIKPETAELLTTMDTELSSLTDEIMQKADNGFMAYHLDCGYRVDVRILKEEKNELVQTHKSDFRSLCRREADYVVDRKDDDLIHGLIKKDLKLFLKLRDEPWLEEVRQIDDEGNQNRFEEITRWNNWSLTCPPLNAISKPNPEFNDLELQNIRPVELPKLRFDCKYQFRIRTVDICGNGVSFDFKDENNKQDYISPIVTYNRKERLGAPLFFPTHAILTNSKDKNRKSRRMYSQYYGEDNETLVIRSKVDASGNIILLNPSCIRMITPQNVSFHLAEASGVLENKDGNFKDREYLFGFLKNTPKEHYSEEEINKNIPFLFDPKVFSIRIYDFKGTQINPGKTYAFREKQEPKENIMEKSRAITLMLITGNSNNHVNSEDPVPSNKIILPLAKGLCHHYQIQSFSEDGLSYSDSKTFNIVHAVQKPVLLNTDSPIVNGKLDLKNCLKVEKITPNLDVERKDQKYEAMILPKDSKSVNINNYFPFSTSGELAIIAEYEDYQLDKNSPDGWNFISQSIEGKDSRLGESVRREKADKFHIRKSWSNLDETPEIDFLASKIKDETTIGQLFGETITNLEDKLEYFDRFRHSFPDTKFRMVNYRLEAISKYQNFFDEKGKNSDFAQDNAYNIFGSIDSQVIKNSAKPSKPKITSIIPIFSTTGNDNTEYNFIHDTFRIYLGETWYETGLYEKIAVIHEEKANSIEKLKHDANNSPTESIYLRNKISIFANDPTNYIVNKEENVLRIIKSYMNESYLDKSYVLPDTSLQINANLLENTIENSVINKSKKDHRFSVFDVQWDKQEDQFYCDIKLNREILASGAYLIKFAICRYQEHSIIKPGIYDYRFSDAVATDLVKTLPNRTIKFIKSNNEIHNIEIIGSPVQKYVRLMDKNKKARILPKENQFYLISEDISVSEGVSNISCENNCINIFKIKLGINELSSLRDQNNLPLDIKKMNNFFIEEYEDLQLDDDFIMNENDKDYNPRNDPRKRLVFFYNGIRI
jgi:hypothetical protein